MIFSLGFFFFFSLESSGPVFRGPVAYSVKMGSVQFELKMKQNARSVTILFVCRYNSNYVEMFRQICPAKQPSSLTANL